MPTWPKDKLVRIPDDAPMEERVRLVQQNRRTILAAGFRVPPPLPDTDDADEIRRWLEEGDRTIGRLKDTLAAFGRATKNLPNDTEVAAIGANGLELLPDFADKVRAADQATEDLGRIRRSEARQRRPAKRAARRRYWEAHALGEPYDRLSQRRWGFGEAPDRETAERIVTARFNRSFAGHPWKLTELRELTPQKFTALCNAGLAVTPFRPDDAGEAGQGPNEKPPEK